MRPDPSTKSPVYHWKMCAQKDIYMCEFEMEHFLNTHNDVHSKHME